MTQFKKGGAPFIEDFMRMAEGAFGTFAGMRSEWEAVCRQQVERLLSRMDIPTREELEVVKEMQAKILQKLEAMEKKKSAPAADAVPKKASKPVKKKAKKK